MTPPADTNEPPPARRLSGWALALDARALLMRHTWIVELAVLAGVFALLAGLIVRAHVASLWHDPEFMGWVAPITNRVAAGQRLYTDGGHSPLPPLPVLLLLLAGHATWLTESVAHFLFQALTIGCVYIAFSRHLQRPAPFVAALATLPNFFALPKAILYDPMAQFFVALTILQTLEYLAKNGPGDRPGRGLRPWRSMIAAGAATAGALLTKQNTGAGALAGVLLALALARGLDPKRRATAMAYYLGATVLAIGILACLMLPWVSPSGLWVDVIRTGAEAKGGSDTLVSGLRKSLATIFTNTFTALPGGAVIAALIGMSLAVCARTARAHAPEALRSASSSSSRTQALVTFACLGAFVAMGATTLWLEIRYTDQALEQGILLAIGLVVFARLTRIPKHATQPTGGDLLFAAMCVAVPAALAHNLSIGYLRWTYDNNPLIPVALTVLATALCNDAIASGIGMSRPALGVVAVMLLQGLTSGRALDRWSSLASCTERWSEVDHLRGARLPASAAGMRTLVARVRELTAEKDEVLLLPDDPDAYAWFQRRRPAVSSQIIFTDQYWDRYVDEDFRRLSARPPKVIVIGPRNAWRPFSRMWHPDLGAERLIIRVQNELIPARYRRLAEQPITYQKRVDYMDVFLLN
jgi:hypothetical protein